MKETVLTAEYKNYGIVIERITKTCGHCGQPVSEFKAIVDYLHRTYLSRIQGQIKGSNICETLQEAMDRIDSI